MMKQFMHALLCLCLLLPIGAKAEEFSDVFVFGDSLSDTGNVAVFADAQAFILTGNPAFLTNPDVRVALCFPGAFPFSMGDFPCADLFFESSRVSNGPVAVEVLAENLESAGLLDFGALKPSLHFLPLIGLGGFRLPPFGTNYAVAGAHAVPPDPTDPFDVLPALPTQINAFLVDQFFAAPSDALYVVMIGGNDVIDAAEALLDALLGLPSAETSEDIITAAVDAIGDNTNLLIGAGARKFLIVNSPNIGSLPLEFPRVKSGLVRVVATFVTIKFNEQLAERLDQIQAEQQELGVEINQFDLFRFFERVRFGGKLLGVFENIKDPCFDSEAYRDNGRPVIFDAACEPDEGGAPKFDDFVFFDAIHPTGKVHAFIGNALFDVVD